MTTTNKQRSHSLLPLGHELVLDAVPALDAVIRAAVADAGSQPSLLGEIGTVPGLALLKLPSFSEWFSAALARIEAEGGGAEAIRGFARSAAFHVHYAVNFELHHRKVFWVEESLAWMLLHTNLDIAGAALKLPFPCFALALQDESSLELLRGHLAKTPTSVDFAAARSLTVYVTHGPRTESGVDVDLSFVIDLGPRRMPSIFVRSLHVRDDDDLDTILASTASYQSRDPGSEELFTAELTQLTRLVVNAILYATSAQPPEGWPVLAAPSAVVVNKAKSRGARRRRAAAHRAELIRASHSCASAFLLPGKISISRFRELRQAERRDGGARLLSRFMVRGHWRRPPSTWTDQRPRWIEPYWKGPEIGTVIEREYRMTL